MSALPESLKNVDLQALENYVETQFRRMAMSLVGHLRPGTTEEEINQALIVASRALQSSNAGAPQAAEPMQLSLRFRHTCKFLGCMNAECALCQNNPNKRCTAEDNFHREFADHQALKTRCDAAIEVELYNQATGQPYNMAGVEVQLSIIDGESYVEASPLGPFATITELLMSDDGKVLLDCNATNGTVVGGGHTILKLQGGRVQLPADLHVTDKTDTFRMRQSAYGSFRMLAVAVQRDERGQRVVVEGVAPAVSDKFVVKTQRAVNDYNKSDYPHHKDNFTKIKYIGNTTLTKLKDVKGCLGLDVPFTCVQTVDELRRLVEYADSHKEVEAALLELFKFRGRHKQRYDIVRNVLAERVVYDDNTPRVWYTNDNVNGLMFACKQAQINFDKPAALVQRMVQPNGSARVLVVPLTDASHHATARAMRPLAEAAWKTPNHSQWQMLTEPTDYISGSGTTTVSGANTVARSMGVAASPLASAGNAHFGGAHGGVHSVMRGVRAGPGVITEGFVPEPETQQPLQHEGSDPSVTGMSASDGTTRPASFTSGATTNPRGRIITSGTSRDIELNKPLRQVNSTPPQGAHPMVYPVMGPANDGLFGVQVEDALPGALRHPSATDSTHNAQQQQQQQQQWGPLSNQGPQPITHPSGLLDAFELDDLLNADSADLENLRQHLHVDSGASSTGTAANGVAAAPYGGAAAVAAAGPPKRLRSKTGERGEPALQQGDVQPTKAFYHMQSMGRHMPRPRPIGDVSDQLSGRQPHISEAEPIDEHRQALIDQLDAIFASSGVGLALDMPGDEGPLHGLHLLHQPFDSAAVADLGPGVVSAQFKDLLALEPLTTPELEQAVADTQGLQRRLMRNDSDSFRHLLLNLVSFKNREPPAHEPAAPAAGQEV